MATTRFTAALCAAGVGAGSLLVSAGPAAAEAPTFPAAQSTVNVDADRPPLAGDFDGDGREDLIWYTGRPAADGIWYGRSDGAVDATLLGAGAGFSPFAGDFNGDRIDDVFWYDASRGTEGIAWYGQRARSWAVALVAAPPAGSTPVVADLDGNGADDVYFDNPAGDDALFTAQGFAFSVEPAYVPPGYASVSGDFDGNGADDIVFYDRAGGQAILWWGSPAGRTGAVVDIGTGFVLRAGDFDGTGIDDLLWYGPGDGLDAVLYGQRGRVFQGAPANAGGEFTPVVGDFDGDRRDDVLWYQPHRAEDLIWFFRPTSIDGLDVSSTVTGTPTVFDGNGDGPDDVLFHVAGSGIATWFTGGLRTSGAAPPTGPPQLTVATVVAGLDHPWDLAFLPDGAMLFTERPGRLSVRYADGIVRTLDADLSDLRVAGETGLLGIAVDPGFRANRRFYTCQGAVDGPQVQVIAWQLDDAGTTATRVADPLVGGLPATSGRHAGCRLRFDATGALLIGTGDAATGTHPQDLTSLGGKVLRVDATTGGAAPGNPFIGAANAATRLVYTYGHRNVQGLAVRPGSGQVFAVEHGPDRDDEVNVLVAGGDHGWNPVPGYNEAVPMTAAGALAARWSSGVPTVAVSGATFLSGPQWRSWDGALAVATLKGAALRVQSYDAGGTLLGEVVPGALSGTYGRLRAAVQGPDGSLYLTTDNGGDDQILKVTPRS